MGDPTGSSASPLSEFPISEPGSLERLITAFERGRLPVSRFNHAMRLALAVWYLWEKPEWDAAERYVNLIRRYNRSEQLASSRAGGYHETIALFWFVLARDFVLVRKEEGDVLAAVNAFVSRYGDEQQRHRRYFSTQLLSSDRARQTWVDPDLCTVDELLSREREVKGS